MARVKGAPCGWCGAAVGCPCAAWAGVVPIIRWSLPTAKFKVNPQEFIVPHKAVLQGHEVGLVWLRETRTMYVLCHDPAIADLVRGDALIAALEAETNIPFPRVSGTPSQHATQLHARSALDLVGVAVEKCIAAGVMPDAIRQAAFEAMEETDVPK